MRIFRILAVLSLVAAGQLQADPPRVYAIRGGTLHPVSGPAIPEGTVVVRDGLIEAVGAAVAVPADATVIDATGSHVYPGLIDAQSTLGLAAPKEKDAGEPGPDSLAARSLSLSEDDLSARHAIGVTTLVVTPGRGIFNGQSAVVNLGDGEPASRIVKSPVATQISFNPRETWTWPDSLMGVIAHIRQTFLDAQQHAAARAVYAKSPAGLKRPVDSAALEALEPVLQRSVPVVFVADSEEMIRRAQSLAREFNLRYIIAGAREAYGMAPELKEIPLLVSVRWVAPPADESARAEEPLRLMRARQLAPTTPAALARSGATFALVSGSGKTGDFLPGIRKAIENGLSADDALRATTLSPARIFGIDRQLGSIERGKIANLVVSDQPIFEEKAKVVQLFIDGRQIRLPEKEAKEPVSAAAPIDGSWAITVRAPQGNVNLQVTLHAEGTTLSGTYSSDRGSGDVRGGSIEGDAFSFTIATTAQETAEMTDWVFNGKLEGDAMSGTVATTLGKFEFSGSRAK